MACTEIGCEDGLQIELSAKQGWLPGVYRFVVIADGRETACQGSLPLRSCDQGASLACDDPGVIIGESGCALPPEQHGFSNIQMPIGPASFTLTIERDEQEIVSKSMTPAYVESQPNGPGCPPVCRQAGGKVPLP